VRDGAVDSEMTPELSEGCNLLAVITKRRHKNPSLVNPAQFSRNSGFRMSTSIVKPEITV